ncbi:MAG: hypothetical protein ABR579_01575 [Actinomycetota bacterium]
MTKALRLFVCLSVVATMLVGAIGGAQARRGPGLTLHRVTVVGTDPAGDWGDGSPQETMMGTELGQDLTKAAIAVRNHNVNFIIKVASLPPNGGWPELTTYSWELTVDGRPYWIVGKYTDFSRQTCDPTYAGCPPQSPQDPGVAPFSVRGCLESDTTKQCTEVPGSPVPATFDASTGTITIPVPLSMLGAYPGALITPDSFYFRGSVASYPEQADQMRTMPWDELTVRKTFVVPNKA